MITGLVTALVWTALGSPFGLHGFVPGMGVSLLALVVVSLATPRLPREHLERIFSPSSGDF